MKVVLYLILILVVVFFAYELVKYTCKKKNSNGSDKLFNVVLIGAAGSGKGTQSEIMSKEMSLLPLSAGEVLRQYTKNENAKYTKIIKETLKSGQLVKPEIVHEIIGNYINDKVLCGKNCNNYSGIIFDGFPRSMEQLEFLDKFLAKSSNKIDAVVYINVPMDTLVDRLSGRFACSNCGTLYHKTAKPTKVEGVCDVCGDKEFYVREDDKDIEAIKTRFKIFEDTTKSVLENYQKRGLVIQIDGTKTPNEISDEIISRLDEIKNNKS